LKQATTRDEQSIIKANNLVAVDLYSRLAKEDGNLLVSPFSIFAALCMAYAGARRNTAEQMESALHIKIPQNGFHQVFCRFSALLDVSERIDLVIANALSMKAEKQILASYKSLIKNVYRGDILDFSVNAINDWVSRQTRGHITHIVDNLNTAVLILVNAVYFKGLWDFQFDKHETKDSDFYLLSAKTARIPLMHQIDTFRYAEKPAMQILEMVYKGCKQSGTPEQLSMVVFLPKKRNGLPKLEKRITAEYVQKTIASLTERRVKIFFPRFNLETEYELKEPVKDMGMAEAFTQNADFSGITDNPEGLMIQSIIHKATINVDEEGTVATAATAIKEVSGAMPLIKIPQRIPAFHADHPFLFLLRDMNTGIILFVGRFTAPVGLTPKARSRCSLFKTLANRFWNA
jgi:serine protease inhibitor